MGWIISVAMLLIGSFSGNDILVITSGLYAIAGSLSGAAQILKGDNNEQETCDC